MICSTRALCVASAVVGILTGATVHAQPFPEVLYELQEGSTLLDDCFCDRLPIEVPIRGTMVLQRLPVRIVGELHAIKSLTFQSTGEAPGAPPRYTVAGEGTYYRRASEPDFDSMSLDVTINEVSGIQITTEQAEAQGKFPGIDIKISEGVSPPRDEFHIFRARIVAAPVSRSWLYEVVEGTFEPFAGSFFYNDCDICGRPTIPIPVSGFFTLTQLIANDPNPVQQFTVENLSLITHREGFDLKIVGSGTYFQGGEVALLQGMDLSLDVDDEKGIPLASGKVGVPEGVTFPEIQIHLSQVDPPSPARIFRLDLFARPTGAPPPQQFRRGDANADGTGDISDAVFILLWRFSGGSAPTCLEAADSNGDGLHDLSDAVFLLLHLFQGGDAPPAPGLTDCGTAKQEVFGCESYPCG